MAKKQAKSPAWQRSEGKNSEGGLNEKGRKSYERETGGNLKAPVTESNPSGERAKRQNSFCSRMCGMKRVNTGSKAKKDPDSRINKSLRKWNCKCSAAREFGSKMAELMLPSSGGASSSLATPSIDALLKDTTPMPPPAPKKPLMDLDAVSKNLTPLVQADSNRPPLAKSPSPLDPPALHPALGGKPLTRAEINKNPDPVAGVAPVSASASAKKPAPATSTAQKPENAPPASSPTAPSAKPSGDWSGVAAAGGLSAAGLLALYYMMQERNKPKKRREDDE